jgi:predicted RNA-binding protein
MVTAIQLIFLASEKANQDKNEAKRFIPMRKCIADSAARADVSKNIIDRFTEHMSAYEEKTRLGELLNSVNTPLILDGKRVRAIDVFGKDREFLGAISDPAFAVHGITNKGLREILKGLPWANNMSDKQLSARISRHLALLRKHGLIRKLPNQRKYALTDKGRKITAALSAALAASVNDLLKHAA